MTLLNGRGNRVIDYRLDFHVYIYLKHFIEFLNWIKFIQPETYGKFNWVSKISLVDDASDKKNDINL